MLNSTYRKISPRKRRRHQADALWFVSQILGLSATIVGWESQQWVTYRQPTGDTPGFADHLVLRVTELPGKQLWVPPSAMLGGSIKLVCSEGCHIPDRYCPGIYCRGGIKAAQMGYLRFLQNHPHHNQVATLAC